VHAAAVARVVPIWYIEGKGMARVDGEKILIIKTGSTLPGLKSRKGDFESWIMAGMGLNADEVTIVDVTAGEPLPANGSHAGVVVTGSHSMVTEHPRWSERAAQWLALEIAAETPTLGICYGHQLLGYALGGTVEENPLGWELGTVEIKLDEQAARDELLGGLDSVEGNPRTAAMKVHASHTQAVTRLPPGAVRLASSSRDANHAFRVGRTAWGVQFHPEFDCDIVQTYIQHCRRKLIADGQDPDQLMRDSEDTEWGAKILQRFAKVAKGAAARNPRGTAMRNPRRSPAE
jgi:GMP synthase (glutamine-hydrolysing)